MSVWTQSLEGWHDFDVLIGTAAATLMGLTFIAVTLAPEVIADRTSTAVRAFTTPIVAFFATVLVVSLVVLIPGLTPAAAAILFAIIGLGGIAYMLSTGVQRQWREMELGIDDWFWYIALPVLGYVALAVSAAAMWNADPWALYVTAAAALLLLIIGIRNAWDVVITMVQHAGTRDR